MSLYRLELYEFERFTSEEFVRKYCDQRPTPELSEITAFDLFNLIAKEEFDLATDFDSYLVGGDEDEFEDDFSVGVHRRMNQAEELAAIIENMLSAADNLLELTVEDLADDGEDEFKLNSIDLDWIQGKFNAPGLDSISADLIDEMTRRGQELLNAAYEGEDEDA